jgi:putative endonuclease
MSKQYWVYMLASSKDGAIYIGVTSDLIKRIYQHKRSMTKGHTSKYHIRRLVYFMEFGDPEHAIKHEKRLKKYNRQWKIN